MDHQALLVAVIAATCLTLLGVINFIIWLCEGYKTLDGAARPMWYATSLLTIAGSIIILTILIGSFK